MRLATGGLPTGPLRMLALQQVRWRLQPLKLQLTNELTSCSTCSESTQLPMVTFQSRFCYWAFPGAQVTAFACVRLSPKLVKLHDMIATFAQPLSVVAVSRNCL